MAGRVEPHLLEDVEVGEILKPFSQIGDADPVSLRQAESLLQGGLLDRSRVLGCDLVELELSKRRDR